MKIIHQPTVDELAFACLEIGKLGVYCGRVFLKTRNGHDDGCNACYLNGGNMMFYPATAIQPVKEVVVKT